jgi:hypothetical protein
VPKEQGYIPEFIAQSAIRLPLWAAGRPRKQ